MQNKLAKVSAILCLLVSSVFTVTDHSDGLGGDAPCIESYLGVFNGENFRKDGENEYANVEGLVHGIFADDNSVVAVGHGNGLGFIIRTNAGCTYDSSATYLDRFKQLTGSGSGCDQYKWQTYLGEAGENAQALSVAQSSDNSYFIVAGKRAGSLMAVWKINASDGALVWDMTPKRYDKSTIHGGLESVDILSNGDFVFGGYSQYDSNKTDDSTGWPFVASIPKSKGDLTSLNYFVESYVPSTTYSETEGQFNWFEEIQLGTTGTVKGSARSIKVDSSDDFYALIAIEPQTVGYPAIQISKDSALVKIDVASDYGSETIAWQTDLLEAYSQMNDLYLATDGFVLVGHEYSNRTDGCWWGGCPVVKGKMMKLATDGTLQWTKLYGNYPDGINQFTDSGEGNLAHFETQCWGVTNTYDSSGAVDGYALACGTGRNGDCTWKFNNPEYWWACVIDPKQTWRALTIATDLNGERVWSRLDNYQYGNQAVAYTASKQIISDSSNQKLTLITNEYAGFGFATIKAPDGIKCADVFDYDELSAVKLSVSALISIGALYLSF